MISYEKVKKVLKNPPSKDLIDLYNEIEKKISEHLLCVNEELPLKQLYNRNIYGDLYKQFCISATSIHSNFVIGKHVEVTFPDEVIETLMSVQIDTAFNVQYGKVKGEKIDGEIWIIHEQHEKEYFDIHKVYDNIYDL